MPVLSLVSYEPPSLDPKIRKRSALRAVTQLVGRVQAKKAEAAFFRVVALAMIDMLEHAPNALLERRGFRSADQLRAAIAGMCQAQLQGVLMELACEPQSAWNGYSRALEAACEAYGVSLARCEEKELGSCH